MKNSKNTPNSKGKSTASIEKKDLGPLLTANIMESNNSSFFSLYVYKTVDDMKNGVKEFHKKAFNIPYVSDDNIYGMYIPLYNPTIVVINNEELTHFGAIFLNKDNLSCGIIAHECLHAALSNERMVVCYRGNYAGNSYLGNDPEERLTYKFQEYFTKVCTVCEKKGLPIFLDYGKQN